MIDQIKQSLEIRTVDYNKFKSLSWKHLVLSAIALLMLISLMIMAAAQEDAQVVSVDAEANIGIENIILAWQALAVVLAFLLVLSILRFTRLGTTSILLVIGFFALALVCLLIFNTFSIAESMREQEIRSQTQFLSATAYSKANYLTRLEKSYTEELRLISFRPLIIEQFENLLAGNHSYEASLISHLRGVSDYTPHIESISLLDKKGIVRISSDPLEHGKDYSSKEYLGLSYHEEILELEFQDGKPKVFVLGPLRSLQDPDAVIGVMLIKVKADDLINILSDESYLGATGEIYLVNKEGELLFLPRNFIKQNPHEWISDSHRPKINTTQTSICIQKHLNTALTSVDEASSYDISDDDGPHPASGSPEDINVYDDYRGKPVIGVHISVPWLQACIIAEKDESEVIGKTADATSSIWYSTLGLIIGILLLSIISIYLLTRNMRREIKSKTDEIAKINSNLEEMIQARTTELEELNKELESKVDTRTIELNNKVSELQDARIAILNMLEDVSLSKDEIEKSKDDLERINKQMKKANEELKKADYYKNQFISITAHELKTPLASIHGFANLLQSKKILSNTKQRDNYLSIIMQDSDRLKRLIDDILDLSRLDVGTMKFVFEKVDVHEVFKDVMKEMYILASKNSLSLKASISDDLPMIIVDKSRLSQVLINLVSNSVKYNVTKGGKIIVRAERHGRSVLFFVKDTGIGIPKKSQAKIFQRFYQVESWLTRKVGGSGLGLSICKGIVEALGGKIWFKSEEGRGSTFFFTLPIARDVVLDQEQSLSVVKAPEDEGKDKSKNENQNGNKDKNKHENKDESKKSASVRKK